MRSAETVLSIIRQRGEQGLPLERLYRHLYNPDLYLRAYAKLYPNQGAMTRGSTPETVDGMSRAKITRLIAALRARQFRWTPVRRVQIPKANGKTRPLGIATWQDKLVQEVIRSLLEAYDEPQFSRRAHGFRPGHGCHTALREIQQTWTGVRWFVEGDIANYFDTISHNKLLTILSEKIHDKRFVQLIRELLRAGYLEEWTYHRTYSGTPQGSVLSPLLSNVYLDRFDRYIETELIPAYTRGVERRANPIYNRMRNTLYQLRKQGRLAEAKAVQQRLRTLPSLDPQDPGFRRLRYCRYADDWLLGWIGSRREAEEIKRTIKDWLHTHLDLALSDEKTLITNATRDAAQFLGYQIVNQQAPDQITAGRRAINGRIGLRVPRKTIRHQCARYIQGGKSVARRGLLEESDFAIVTQYQQVYRGIVQYYLLAYNVCDLNELRWVMQTSLLKTLAEKHQTTIRTMLTKYRTTIATPEGKQLTCLEVRVERPGQRPLLARFGGIPLQRQRTATLDDHIPKPITRRTELLQRLQANVCELCGATEHIEVHHIRKLADLRDRGGRTVPTWKKKMAAMRRKTLVLCHACHQQIHAGTHDKTIGLRR